MAHQHDYEVTLSDEAACPTAVVKATTTVEQVPQILIGLYDQVYAYLGEASTTVRQRGHNVALYRSLPAGAGAGAYRDVELEVGVQADGPFESSGPVVASSLPGGRAAHAVHWGPYAEVVAAHRAVRQWCEASGHALSGVSWEIYGDPSDDPSKTRTDVYHLLA